MHKYGEKEKLAEGGFGKVYKVRDLVTQRHVALKKIDLEEHMNIGIREVTLLKSLHHPHIIALQEVFIEKESMFLVMELMHRNTRNFQLAKPQMRTCMYQLLSAVCYAHEKSIVHRDIKPCNILLDEEQKRFLLADWGGGRCLRPNRKYSQHACTVWYKPPEALLGEQGYTQAFDIWSLGCTFYELITGHVLFPGNAEIEQLFLIFRLFGTPDTNSWPQVHRLPDFSATKFPRFTGSPLTCDGLTKEGLDLLSRMLICDPSQRITAAQALQHVYFQGCEVIKPCEQKTELAYRPPDPGYLSRHPQLKAKMRTILISWLQDVCFVRWKLRTEVFFLTVNIVDRFLSLFLKEIPRWQLQLVGIAALSLAAMYEEIWAPADRDLLYVTGDTYSVSQLREMRLVVLKTLNYNVATAAEQICPYLTLSAKELSCVQHAVAHIESLLYSPTQIAAAAKIWVSTPDDDTLDHDDDIKPVVAWLTSVSESKGV